MFGASATGLQIDRATFEHLTSEGDVVFTYRYQSVVNGNQAVYSAAVAPAVTRLDFINSPAFNYRSTGYGIVVGNRLSSQNQPVFTQVKATAPDGHVFTLRPRAGLSYLALARENGSLTNTTNITLAARFVDSSTPGNPADKDTGPLYVGTVTRALTLDEAMVQPIATLTGLGHPLLHRHPERGYAELSELLGTFGGRFLGRARGRVGTVPHRWLWLRPGACRRWCTHLLQRLFECGQHGPPGHRQVQHAVGG